MADYLIIPDASPVGWVINTLAPSLNAGNVYYRNELYPKAGAYDCGESYPPFCQPFDCGDILTIQLRHNNDTVNVLTLKVKDENGTELAWDEFAVVSGDYKEAVIDFGAIDPCPGCVQLIIESPDIDDEAVNAWGCGDDGTFETGVPATWGVLTGPNNTITKDNTIFYQGANSAAITAGLTPAAGDEVILQCTDPGPVGKTYNLAANTLYFLRAYVYIRSGTPFIGVGANDQVGFILSGFSDVTILSQTDMRPNFDGFDTWVEINVVFRTGTDTTGEITIESDVVPQASGIVNVDAISLTVMSEISEAQSQWLCVEDLQSGICDRNCLQKITYYNDDDSSGFYYSGGLQNFFWATIVMTDERFEDPLFKDNRSSDGTTDLIKSQLARIVTAKFDLAPAYFHQIIAAASKHDNFLISGYGWHALEAAYQPDYPDKVQQATGELGLIDSTFTIDNCYC